MNEGPVETGTFLFTTLESRATTDTAAAGTPTALRRHMTLLRRAVVAHGGEVLPGGSPTALGARFATALAALSAALETQQAALSEPALSDEQVRMCMALDTLPAPQEATAADPALAVVTRLLAVAHPGQVLLTAATQTALGEGLPQGAMLRDLGGYHLRDLIRPVHIFQLLTLDLPAEFPPLPALAHHPTNIHLPPTPLIGREQERAAAAALLRRDGVRLVTFTGPGGTGKTHLALQVAADVLDHFTHGVTLVALAAIHDPALVIPTIADTLGIKEEPGQPLLDTLLYALRDQHLLLVLDNFEQVIAAAPQVRRLLATTFRVRALVTSRAPLGVYGEHEFPVAPLQVPDVVHLPPLPVLATVPAVTLFAHYAALADARFAVTPHNAAVVATLCARLDGLPLALRLAAAQIKHYDPPAILAHLPQRLTFHNGTLDTLPPLPARQQTLYDTITWSYDLLSPAEQALFRRLAVFTGPFTPAAAAVMTGDGDWGLGVGLDETDLASADPIPNSPPPPPDEDPKSQIPNPKSPTPIPPPPDPLAPLVEKSLLQPAPADGGPARFYMLETIREYGLEQLRARGEAAHRYHRHAAYYLALAERAEPELRGAAQIAWLGRLEREHDNLRAAETWLREAGDWESAGRLVGALRLFWVTHTHLTEGRRRLETVLTRADELTRPVRAKVFHSAGVLAWTQGDNDTARRYFEAALVLRRAEGHQAGTAILLNNLGHLAILRAAYEEGEPLLNEAFALQEAIGDAWGSAHTLSNLGNVAMLRGDYPKAIDLMEQSLARRRALGDTHGMADSLSSLGDVLLLQGASDRADAVFRECLDTFQELGDQSGVADCFQGLAEAAALRGRAVRAARLAGAAEALREAIGGHDWPHLAAYHERLMAAARAQVPPAVWTTAWAAGRAMPLARALTYARDPPGLVAP